MAGREPDLPPGIDLGSAVRLNNACHVFDGVATIEDDGTVVIVPECAAAIRDTLGYDCNRLVPHEADEHAVELTTRLREPAARHGVDLDAATKAASR